MKRFAASKRICFGLKGSLTVLPVMIENVDDDDIGDKPQRHRDNIFAKLVNEKGSET